MKINSKPKSNEKERLPQDDIINEFDYRQNKNILSQLFLLHVARIGVTVKKVLSRGLKLNLNHLPKLMDDQKVENNSSQFIAKLDKIQEKSKLTPWNVWLSLISVYKKKIMVINMSQFCNISLKLFNSVALNFCIQSILNDDKTQAYIWGAVMIISMLFSSLFRQNDWKLGYKMNTELRGALVNTIYQKINNLSAFSIKQANLGKVINLVSSDLNVIEAKLIYLFQLAAAPYTLSIACIILSFRLGPLGMLSILFLILTFPIQKWIGKMASKHTQKRVQRSDERIKLINEIIEGIRIIKMYGWEEAIRNIIEKIRSEEIREIIKACVLQYIDKSLSISSVLVSAALTFIIIHYEGSYELNSAKIFSTIEMLSYLRTNLMMYSGYAFGFIFELQIFLKRFIEIYVIKDHSKQYQEADEKYRNNKLLENEIAIFENFNAFWRIPESQNNIQKVASKTIQTNQNIQAESLTINTDNEQNILKDNNEIQPTLKNLTFSINKGELIGIVGKIGSGKTTFLQCFLKEIPYYNGLFKVQQTNQQGRELSLAYVEQEPYIFSSTVRENILFGLEFDESWYNLVVQSCSLLADFQQLEDNDQTVIGERGVNLSGGQKARICLARAVYRKADLYLLDDPLSAVDSKVALDLFINCIQTVLKDKTVILVTHQIHFTRTCDRIIIFNEDGSVKNIGKFEILQDELKKLAAGQLKFENNDEESTNTELNEKQAKNYTFNDEEVKNKELRQEIETQLEEIDLKDQKKQNKLQNQSQSNESVEITLSTYTNFIKSINKVFFCFPIITLILFILSECAFTSFNRGLGYYDKTSDDSKGKLFAFLIGFAFLYLIINATKFIILSSGKFNCKIAFTNQFDFYVLGFSLGNKNLHNQMLKSLIRAPILFFDRISSGSLMNKFSNDINLLDNMLHFASNDSIDIMANFLNLLITCCVFNPYIILPGITELILLFGFLLYCKGIINGTRQMDLAYKTPVFQHFQQTLQGTIAIKVYKQNDRFLRKMETLSNNSLAANQGFWMVSRFFGGFTQIFAIACSAVGIFIIISLPSDDPTKQAQSLTYFMLMVDAIQWCLRQILTTDSIMSSYERIQTLVNLQSEAPLEESPEIQNEYKQQLVDWPSQGSINFNNVFMRYSKEMNPVLKGLSFDIQSGQKIGCVGRTGAGKSSVLQVLFRLTEADLGSQVKIDGIDIFKLGLHTLRQRISIIPQVPFVFGGTIRRNLDPFNQYTDESIWNCLQMVELDGYVKNNCTKGIYTDMSVASSVFSVGQKQLICLARALLKKNKILVLDEATANVDMETDDLIQKTIRSKFKDSTVLTIAHRLNTIADYDKVIVMNDGVLAEYDSPFNLLVNSKDDQFITKNTIFAQMVKNTGKNNSESIFQISKKKFLEQ